MNSNKVHCVQLYVDYSIRVYGSFTTVFHKCINIANNILIFYANIMLMFPMTHYYYAGIIGGSLHMTVDFTLI